MPNQSLMDILDDIHHTENGYFIWNPIYKAHKFDKNGKHIPKIRPIISSNKSPLKPVLKLMAEGCKILIHVLQNMYNIVNVVEDSFHVIELIENYIKFKFDSSDVILTFDFVSFYTELQIKFINDKLTYLHQMFKCKYDTNSKQIYYTYMHIVNMIKEGYDLASKYCIIKIENKFYVQKQGVIMGASFAPNLANLSVLIHMIQNKIHKCNIIKLNLRMVDDTLLILRNTYNNNIDNLFKKFYPQCLQFTTEYMNNNKIKFLDILFIKINNTLQYIMQIKKLKLEFFVPYVSNHPKSMKINIVKNMVDRATILCSNYLLFQHTFIALRLRFHRSGYPDHFLIKHMNMNTYKNRNVMLNKLNNNRINKIKAILQLNKIIYKPIWIPDEDKRYIVMLYDNMLINDPNYQHLKQYIHNLHPNKRIVYKLNNSIHKIIRCKDAQYSIL